MTRAMKLNAAATATVSKVKDVPNAKRKATSTGAHTHAHAQPEAANVEMPKDWKPTWARAFIGTVTVLTASFGLGYVFGVVSAALIAAAAMLTTSAFVALAIEFVMLVLMFATVTIVGAKLWDGVMSGSIERRAGEAWGDVKGWFAMRAALKAMA